MNGNVEIGSKLGSKSESIHQFNNYLHFNVCSAKFQFVNQEFRKIMFHHVIYQMVLGVWVLSIMEFNHDWTRLHCCLVISLLCKVNSDENYMYISRTVVINTLQSICWLRPGSKNFKNITARSFKHDSHLPHQTNIGITYGGRYLSPLFSRWEKKHSVLGLYDIKNGNNKQSKGRTHKYLDSRKSFSTKGGSVSTQYHIETNRHRSTTTGFSRP